MKILSRENNIRARKMAQKLKVLETLTNKPEFDSQDLHSRGEKNQLLEVV